MGISFSAVQRLKDLDVISPQTRNLLDIGSSNLYNANDKGLQDFIKSLNEKNNNELEALAKKLAEGSAYDLVTGGINEAFIGELFDACGIDYTSFDIADGYKTEIIDLNNSGLPEKHYAAYDVVFNFGTTEHILNQYNCFKIIHEATRKNGYMVHQLPISGFTDHGYFVYTGRNLFDLAKFNNYEIVNLWFDGPLGSDDLYESIKAFKSEFPILETIELPDAAKIPNHSITIIYKKIKNGPFGGMIETTTSVGNIPGNVQKNYNLTRINKIKLVVRNLDVIKRNPKLKNLLLRLSGRKL